MNEKFDFFVGVGRDGAEKLATKNVAQISTQQPPLKAYFCEEKFWWLSTRSNLLPNVAHLVQSGNGKLRICVIGKCRTKIVEKFIKKDCEYAGWNVDFIEVCFSSEQNPDNSSFVYLKEDYGSILALLYSIIETRKIEPVSYRMDGLTYLEIICLPADYVMERLPFNGEREREFIQNYWKKINKRFKKERKGERNWTETKQKIRGLYDSVLTVPGIVTLYNKFLLFSSDIERRYKHKNIELITEDEFFVLLGKEMIESFMNARPIRCTKNNFFPFFLMIIASIIQRKRPGFLKIAEMTNYTINSLWCPWFSIKNQKKFLKEYASSGKDLSNLLTDTYQYFEAYDVWAIIGNEKLLNNVVDDLTRRIIEKWKEKDIELIIDKSLESVVMAAKLRKRLIDKGISCTIKKNGKHNSKTEITLWVCPELRIIPFEFKSIISQATGVVGIIDNAWDRKELPKAQFFYFQFQSKEV